jgi:hypothetical protein
MQGVLSSLLSRLHLASAPSRPTPSPEDLFTASKQRLPESSTREDPQTVNSALELSAPRNAAKKEELDEEIKPDQTHDPASPATVVCFTTPDEITRVFPVPGSTDGEEEEGGGGGYVSRSHEPFDLSPEFDLAHRKDGNEEGEGLKYGYETVEKEIIAEFG